MSADSFDNYDYERASDHTSKAQRRHYWAVAIGLQKVDNLDVSNYLRENANAYIEGEKSLDEVGSLIRSYHSASTSANHTEADLVSQRIVELLARKTFHLAPEMLSRIHEYLFQDLDPKIYRPGVFKAERMIKQEEILNGDSVLYADPITYDMALQGAISAEAAKVYQTFDVEELKGFCHSIAFIWQVHPFYEGNTRTVAVFSELYLNQLGFDVANEPFAEHARYFRDALVRASYRNASAGIFPNERFLISFYENVLGFKQNNLEREDLMCLPLFEEPSLLRNVDPAEALTAKK